MKSTEASPPPMFLRRRFLPMPASRKTRKIVKRVGKMPSGDKPRTYSIATLLTRNLHDVFGENNSARRRSAIDAIFTEDCVFYRGRDEIDRVADAIKATHPDFRYQPIAEPEELGNGVRIQWVSAASLRRD